MGILAVVVGIILVCLGIKWLINKLLPTECDSTSKSIINYIHFLNDCDYWQQQNLIKITEFKELFHEIASEPPRPTPTHPYINQIIVPLNGMLVKLDVLHGNLEQKLVRGDTGISFIESSFETIYEIWDSHNVDSSELFKSIQDVEKIYLLFNDGRCLEYTGRIKPMYRMTACMFTYKIFGIIWSSNQIEWMDLKGIPCPTATIHLNPSNN